MSRFLGLDVGGANLKASDGEQTVACRPFPLWKEPHRLVEALRELVRDFPPAQGLAVTMTGELADCFRTKAEGVDQILNAVTELAAPCPVVVWQTGAEFVSPAVAREIPLLVAAANWHALATWVGRLVPRGFSLLIDVGSTTTDVVPLLNGVPIPQGLTDRERLASGELVYTGVRRTPVCALAQSAPFRGQACPVAAEFFASTWDAYLVLEKLPEEPRNFDTANGQPATREAAYDRLARQLCCDRTELTWQEAVRLAEHLAERQRRQISAAIDQVLSAQSQPLSQVLISGSGGFLIESLCQRSPRLKHVERTSLAEVFRPEIAEAACAFAVAKLANERVSIDRIGVNPV